MAFVKTETLTAEFDEIHTLEDAKNTYQEVQDFDHKSFCVEKLLDFEGGAEYLTEELKHLDTPKNLSAHIAAQLSKLDPEIAPIEEIMDLLKLKNAYVRNLGICILQDYGLAIKYYIVKFLIGDDKDLRIFAVNVLGDVKFAESRDMLVELLETEEDINVAMTAVDYMSEIGQLEDLDLLVRVKNRFVDEPYVAFAIDRAIECIEAD